MSEGKDKYDERMRLRSENELLHEQQRNQRLKIDAIQSEIELVASASVLAFLKGEAQFNISPGNSDGFYSLTFSRPADNRGEK